MDTITTYRNIVKQVMLQYARLRPSHGNIRLDAVLDEARDHYALMQVGWDRGRRVRGNLVYVTMSDDRVYIEYDGIEHGITQDLIKRGISQDRIVLAFLPETQGATQNDATAGERSSHPFKNQARRPPAGLDGTV